MTRHGRLNPCFNGICSATKLRGEVRTSYGCLNPCFNGICSATGRHSIPFISRTTCLNPCFNGICSATHLRTTTLFWTSAVSILVLMEYALRLPLQRLGLSSRTLSLNPCFNGICSATLNANFSKLVVMEVSILVLMEYALRQKQGWAYFPYPGMSQSLF